METLNEKKLTAEQEQFILTNHKLIKDLNLLTQKVFNNEDLDGRSIEGKLVKMFLIKNEIKFSSLAFRVSKNRSSYIFKRNVFLAR
jgi:hypothetical protein